MAYETILYDLSERGVATITLNRPDKFNAFTDTMIAEVTHAFKVSERDNAVRAIVLTGAGRGFCAGQDLETVQGRTDTTMLKHVRERYNPMILQIRQTEKPVIGAINGAAAGAGASVALSTDIRILSSKASFVFAAFAGIGLVPDNGLSYFLPRYVGMAKAFELTWLADRNQRVTAEQALQLNLCSLVVAPEDFAEATLTLANRLAQMPTRALGLTKRMLNATWDNNLAQMLDMEAQLQEIASHSADHHEGIQAFLDKREPVFTGR
jgi:2-(1,2-epoxy-1,2-dihydrophenyl)acetyl-CoA isomerase